MFRTCSVLVYFDENSSDSDIEKAMELIENIDGVKGASYLMDNSKSKEEFEKRIKEIEERYKYTYDKSQPIEPCEKYEKT